MTDSISRRAFTALAGVGSLIHSTALPGMAAAQGSGSGAFSFVQLSDMHWGYANDTVNPQPAATLARMVETVNALPQRPDFAMFTGDLTHSTDDPGLRRRRLAEFKEISGRLNVPRLRFMCGEHDAALDRGEAYREFFGELYYTFDHRGVHFIVLDNTSDPGAALGEAQLRWLAGDLAQRDREEPIVVFTHRPLFALKPDWDWATRDGAAAIDMLMPFRHLTVFYGHIHQLHTHHTGHIAHHAAAPLMFALSTPDQPRKAQLPWEAAQPFQKLGWRAVALRGSDMPTASEHALAT